MSSLSHALTHEGETLLFYAPLVGANYNFTTLARMRTGEVVVFVLRQVWFTSYPAESSVFSAGSYFSTIEEALRRLPEVIHNVSSSKSDADDGCFTGPIDQLARGEE